MFETEYMGTVKEMGLKRQFGISVYKVQNVSIWHVKTLLIYIIGNLEKTIKNYFFSFVANNDLSVSIIRSMRSEL